MMIGGYAEQEGGGHGPRKHSQLVNFTLVVTGNLQ